MLAWQSTEPLRHVWIERQYKGAPEPYQFLAEVVGTAFVDPACGVQTTCCYRLRYTESELWTDAVCLKTKNVLIP